MSKSVENRYGKIIGIIGNVLLWVSLLAYFIVMPFYFKNGYERIATRKYYCFMTISKYSAIVLGVFILVYLSTWGFSKEERVVFKPLWKIDLGMLLFITVSFISYRLSHYKVVGEKTEDSFFYEGSLYGTQGWYMGFVTLLILVFLYFAISRFFTYTNLIWIPILIATTIVFAWGMLNRYGIYPIEMEFGSEIFISSFGNINWFAGFVSVLAPIVVGLFYSAQKSSVNRLLVIPLIFSHGMVFLNNSDSIVFAYLIMLFVLFLYSLDSKDKMVSFSIVLFSFSAVGFGLFFIDKALPGMKEGTSQFADIFTKGASSIAIFAITLIFATFMGLCDEGKIQYSEEVGKKFRKIFIVAAVAGTALVILLIIANTVTGGVLPIIGHSRVFFFDSSWGSDRGATWTSGALLFKDLSLPRKLLGVGPDMFYFKLRDTEVAYAYASSVFGSSRLTNAHNELITLLVNVGIVGTVAFIFAFASAIKVFIRASKERPYIIAFALSVICYIANNIFSFQQITNTPYVFLIIALGAAAVASGKHSNGKA